METISSLNTVDEVLLRTLRGNGGWMTRRDLTDALGATSQYHWARLEELEKQGLVEIGHQVRGIAQKVFRYRAK